MADCGSGLKMFCLSTVVVEVVQPMESLLMEFGYQQATYETGVFSWVVGWRVRKAAYCHHTKSKSLTLTLVSPPAVLEFPNTSHNSRMAMLSITIHCFPYRKGIVMLVGLC